MKKLNLDTPEKKASFFAYVLNKARFNLAISYNMVSEGTARGLPLEQVLGQFGEVYPLLYGDVAMLKEIVSGTEADHSMDGKFELSSERLENIRISLEALNQEAPGGETPTALVSRVIALSGLMFSDFDKLEKEFRKESTGAGITVSYEMEWVDVPGELPPSF